MKDNQSGEGVERRILKGIEYQLVGLSDYRIDVL